MQNLQGTIGVVVFSAALRDDNPCVGKHKTKDRQ